MNRIESTLELVRGRLNAFFSALESRDEDWVVLSNVVDHDGRTNEHSRNKIVMILVNLQHETVVSTFQRNVPVAGDQFAVTKPPLFVDLFVLVLANFLDRNYREGLKAISGVLSFFQQNPSYTPATLPGLDPEIEKLSFEMVNLELTDLNYLMSLVGLKYLPSVYYKVRMIPYRGGPDQRLVPVVKQI